MGTSNWQNISYCCELIWRIEPRRVLDIGIGSLGRWSLLSREFSDVWGGRVLPEEWECTIDGVEAYAPQVHALHRHLYDHVFVGDAFEIIDRLDHYDLIILGDVIEHFPPRQARTMLVKAIRQAGYVLVVTPLGTLDEWPQDERYGNRWEEHLTIFTEKEFLATGSWRVISHRLFRDYAGRSLGAFLLRAPYLGVPLTFA